MDENRVNYRPRFLVRVLMILAASAVLGWAGCRSINPFPVFGVGATNQETRIARLMEWHSGRVEVYKDFRTVFTARAVYISDEIRSLVVDWEARSRLLNPDEKQALLEDTFAGSEASVQILLGFYTPDYTLNNLETKASPWVLYLERPDGSIRRAVCKSVREEEVKIFMQFLNWDLSWSRLYLLCFPGEPDAFSGEGGKIDLVISGPKGVGKIPLRTVSPPP